MTNRRLSIEVECVPHDESGKQYSRWIKNREIPRGVPLSVTYYITNLDNQSYSITTGKISITSIEPLSGKPSAILKDESQGLRDLIPKKKTMLHKTIIRMPVEGNAEFKCILKPYNEGEKIEYFTKDGALSLGMESWVQPFKVIAREQLEIIGLLAEIRDNTKELLSKSKY